MDDKEYCLKNLIEKVESDERILQFKFQHKNTLVWPFIRFSIYRMISSKKLNYSETLSAVNKANPIRTCLHEIIKCIKIGLNIPLFCGRKDILYFCYTEENIISSDGEKTNRLYGGFISEYSEQSGVIETLVGEKYKKDVHDNTRYLDPINFWIDVFSRLSRPNKKDVVMADSIVNYLCNECQLPLSKEEIIKIKKDILLHSKSLRYIDKIFPIIFRKIAPKIVFFEMGYYGGKNAYLIKILHSMGVKTAEIQHGIVAKNHEAYVYSQLLCNSPEYAVYSPDYFLGWGDYWLDKISIPGTKISVGNPFFWQQYYSNIKPVNLQKEDNCRAILWLAFIDNDKNILFLDKFIDISHNAYYIRVRLHPVCRALKTVYKKYENNDKIIIDELQTVYEAFAEADYVISEDSTAAYEALGMGKTVYVLDSEESRCYETVEIAPCFRSPEELVTLLAQEKRDKQDNENIAKTFFGEMWQIKFKQFMETVGV